MDWKKVRELRERLHVRGLLLLEHKPIQWLVTNNGTTKNLLHYEFHTLEEVEKWLDELPNRLTDEESEIFDDEFKEFVLTDRLDILSDPVKITAEDLDAKQCEAFLATDGNVEYIPVAQAQRMHRDQAEGVTLKDANVVIDEEAAVGKYIAKVLGLKENSKGRIDTTGGDKTYFGLFLTMKRIVEEKMICDPE